MGFDNIEIIPSNFPEDLKKEDFTPKEYVKNTAIGKANAVYEELKSKGLTTNTIILAADTVVELEGKIYEKPKDKEDQFTNLKRYRDSEHNLQVLTGVVIIVDGKLESFVESTTIEFDKSLTDDFLKSYVNTNEGLGVAAGFRVQLRGALMIKKIEGDYYNCVGLPFASTFKLLEKSLE